MSEQYSAERFKLGGGFHLISTAMEVTVKLPIVISDSLRIERPDDELMFQVRTHLPWVDTSGHAHAYFESTEVRLESPLGSVSYRAPLPESEQRYLLLTFSGNGQDADVFFSSAQLVVPTLCSLLSVYTSEAFGLGDFAGIGGDTLAYQRQIREWTKREPHPVLDEIAVESITKAYASLRNLDRGAHPGTWRAVELFGLFSRTPLLQVFEVVAMFMLIEMLLTHNPNDKEIGDSLTHQVLHKVPFVFERRNEQIDYSVFRGAQSDVVWKKLYAYRSAVAHGDEPDFTSKLQILRDADTANRFLTDITRRLIRFSVEDPKLFEGLKPL
jgi:hypothetical protein